MRPPIIAMNKLLYATTFRIGIHRSAKRCDCSLRAYASAIAVAYAALSSSDRLIGISWVALLEEKITVVAQRDNPKPDNDRGEGYE